MIRHRTAAGAVTLCWLLVWAGQGFSAEPAPKPLKPPSKERKDEFLRLTYDGKKAPLTLETAVVRCVPRDCGKTSPTVDLIAALHVADKPYYQELNRRFATYDVVLYELVAPKGTKVPAGGERVKGGHPVSMIQTAMSRFLDLTFQLDVIDYTRPNLVHADMSPEQLAESMRERGESVWTILTRMFVYAMSQEDSGSMSEARLLAALLNKNRALAVKRVVAEQFRDVEGSISALEGPKGSALISGRNQVALKELRKAIDAGHRKIAIFYGGGHMSDFQRRLKDDFDLVPIETQWLVAWDLKQTQPAGSAKPAPEAGSAKPAPEAGATGKPSGR